MNHNLDSSKPEFLKSDVARWGQETKRAAERLVLPGGMAAGVALAYQYGPKAASPIAAEASNYCLAWVPQSWWLPIVRWLLITLVILVVVSAHKQYLEISALRREHWALYARFAAIITISGNWWTDLLWAFAQAILAVGAAALATLSICVAVALGVQCNWWLIIFLLMILAVVPSIIWQLTAFIVRESLKPRRLEREVKNAARMIPQLEERLAHYRAHQKRVYHPADEEVQRDAW